MRRFDAVVVIDVLRAFSTAAYAAMAGVTLIWLADGHEHARQLAASIPDGVTLTDRSPSAGLDLANSPAMLEGVALAGRSLIMTTTHGVPATLAARDAGVLLCASFVNARATVAYLRALGLDAVQYVASGGADADEDLACADYLTALTHDPTVDASPYLARAAASRARAALDRRVASGDPNVHVDDVDYCLRLDAAPVALVGASTVDTVILVPHRNLA